MRFADTIAARAAPIAELETRDDGQLLREMNSPKTLDERGQGRCPCRRHYLRFWPESGRTSSSVPTVWRAGCRAARFDERLSSADAQLAVRRPQGEWFGHETAIEPIDEFLQ